MIVVMPNGNGGQEAAPGEYPNSMYKPSFMNPKTMEGSFEVAFPDIVSYVESHYRTVNDKAHRAIAACRWADSIRFTSLPTIPTCSIM